MCIVLIAVIAAGTCGCWMMAAQLAPIALGAAEDVGSGAVYAASGVTGMMKGKHAPDDQQSMDVGEQGVCDQLQQEVPGVIEVRMSNAGSFEYREMRLGGTTDEAQWIAFTDTETAAGGWRPAVNFLQMNFTPPLSSALSDEYFNYIAYAPAQSESEAEKDRNTSMDLNFGKTVGTFNWAGRQYNYAVTHALPCFPTA
ncbi:MAG TPA: hypothetical protein VIX59_12830 [Candidatus Binataceae bacterium]